MVCRFPPRGDRCRYVQPISLRFFDAWARRYAPLPNLRLLNIENIFNKGYWATADGNNNSSPGQPRTFRLKVTAKL